MEKLISTNIEHYDGEFETMIEMDNTSNYKTLSCVQKFKDSKTRTVSICVDVKESIITINDVPFKRIEALMLLDFLNQIYDDSEN
ncbi:MAG: hypothetical protein Wins2KO_04030 [Winogradskyella sp.]